MSVLSPTPAEWLVDRRRRPYFLWDCDLDIDQFRARLRDPDPNVRGFFVGKLMREARPDDVFEFVSLGEIVELWPRVLPFLGRQREFWMWILGKWGVLADAA